MGLISFHITITLTCLTTRNYGNFQIVLFFSLCKYPSFHQELFKNSCVLNYIFFILALICQFGIIISYNMIILCFSVLMVFFSESINEFASKNWALFSRQQYFDSKGLFISIVFSVPILLNCMIMVVSIFCFIFKKNSHFILSIWKCESYISISIFIPCTVPPLLFSIQN